MAMYIDIVPNRQSPPAVLLRESYRQHGKVKKRTIANLSNVPADVIKELRIILRGGRAVELIATSSISNPARANSPSSSSITCSGVGSPIDRPVTASSSS